jgi:hypothetical protein
VHKRGKADIDHEAIRTELDTLQFPLYFVDYESFNPAIPRFSGYKPYRNRSLCYTRHRIRFLFGGIGDHSLWSGKYIMPEYKVSMSCGYY